MALDKSDFWHSTRKMHPPITDGMVLYAEKELGVKLPELLIELLKIQNGVETHEFAFPMTEATTWAANHVPLFELFGIVVDLSVETEKNLFDSPALIQKHNLPEKQIIITGDGHWWITLDYRNGDVPSVRWFDIEYKQDIHIADTFDDYIHGLVPDTNYPMN